MKLQKPQTQVVVGTGKLSIWAKLRRPKILILILLVFILILVALGILGFTRLHHKPAPIVQEPPVVCPLAITDLHDSLMITVDEGHFTRITDPKEIAKLRDHCQQDFDFAPRRPTSE